MGNKSVETLGSKIRFWSVLVTFSPLPPKTMLIFLILRLHRPQRLHNIELGGRGYQRINARCINKIQQLFKYRKASFPKSISTTFVAHFSFLADHCQHRIHTKTPLIWQQHLFYTTETKNNILCCGTLLTLFRIFTF